MELIPLTNSGHKFWSLGGSIWGEGDGREVSQAD